MKHKYIPLHYLPKSRGGRLKNVATFTQKCDAQLQEEAEWIMIDTLQFGFVGLANLLEKPCAIKLMEWGVLADKEKIAFDWFRIHPHRNVIQGICYFQCKDSPIRWKSRLTKPQVFCRHGNTPIMVYIQEYIEGGDLSAPRQWTIASWKSVFFQMTYACFEWHENGFYFMDWNLGNILIDRTDESESILSYKVFDKTIRVRTEGICPVITDFGRSMWCEPNLTFLTDNLGVLWDLLKHTCPNEEWKKWLDDKSVAICHCRSKTAILRGLSEVRARFGS